MVLQNLKKDWDDLGNLDPLWAILTFPGTQFGRWNLEEFFRRGQDEIDQVMQNAERLGYPAGRDSALDFGCGVGRLTRALTKYFRRCQGVDISGSMIAKAKELNGGNPQCEFQVSASENLPFSNEQFDLVYSFLTLQHVPDREAIRSYICEFIRVIKKDGLLVFQLLSYVPLHQRIQPRRRLYSFLRMLGVSEKILYTKLRLHPLVTNFIPELEVVALLAERGARRVHTETFAIPGRSRVSKTYYVLRSHSSGNEA